MNHKGLPLGFWGKNRVFIIAEAGSNWRMGTPQRDLAMARALVECAAEAGADAVKFQTFRPQTLYAPNAGASDYLAEAGINQPIAEVLADLALPHEMIAELAAYAGRCGIKFLNTAFSLDDFQVVDQYVQAHKIASYEISHPHLLSAAGRSGKPLILSTGASSEEDIAWALRVFEQAGGKEVVLLQCTAKYPAPPESMNLAVIPRLAERFGRPVGLSDHSRDPLLAPVAAVALGAVVIEKHFTLHNRLPGPDHAFAVSAEELKEMVRAVREAHAMLGSGVKEIGPHEQELASFARRGLQATRDISRGEILAEGVNFAVLRPGKQPMGVHPRHLAEIEGKSATRAIPAGEGLRRGDWDE